MAAPAILKIDIVADATKALKAMGDTGDAAGKMTGGFSNVGKTVGGVLAGGAVVAFGTKSVKAAEESAVANARLEQIFASMGDTTGQAASSAEDYASALSKKTGVDDEAIMSGQAQLATFGDVSSETARMAGIFDRATSAGADLAAAGFGTIDSNAVQLGKALQDPTKGMTALARSGVTFTDSQKDQIKAMQESGDLLGAQKLVLQAVETQVGGTAEATATSTGKMAVKFGELQEQLGGKLLPVVSQLAEFFTKYMDVLIPLAAVILGVVAATKAWELAQAIWNGVQLVGNALLAAWNLLIALNPVFLIVAAVVGLIAIIVLLYLKVGWFRDLVDAAFHFVVDAFNWIIDAAKAVFDWVSGNWPLLLAILGGPFGLAILVIVRNFDTIRDVVAGVISWIANNWPLLLAILTGPFGLAVLLIVRNFDTIRDAVTGVYDWIVDKFNAVVGFFSGIADRIGGIASNIANAVKGPLNAVIRAWNGLEFTVPSVDVGPIHFGGQTIGLPDIPTLARGGRVLSTGMALVHEGERFDGGRGFGSTTINVNITHSGLGADSPQLQRDVVNAIRGYTARNGPLGSPIVASA